jgi:hypothetical protein
MFLFGFTSGMATFSVLIFILVAVSRNGNKEYQKKLMDLNIRIRESVESTDSHLIDILERLSRKD